MRPVVLLVGLMLALAGCTSKKDAAPEPGGDASAEGGSVPDEDGAASGGASGGTVPSSAWRYDNRTGEASGVAPETESNPPVKPVHETFTVAEGVVNLSIIMTVEDYDHPNAWVYPPCQLEDASACPVYGFGVDTFENGTVSREFSDPEPGAWRVRFTSGAGVSGGAGPYEYSYTLVVMMRP